MTNERFSELFDQPVRRPSKDLLTSLHMGVVASIRAVIEEIVLRLRDTLAHEFRLPNLCLAGGVALNCVANRRALRDGIRSG
jgi:carbamoyltransferase